MLEQRHDIALALAALRASPNPPDLLWMWSQEREDFVLHGRTESGWEEVGLSAWMVPLTPERSDA